MNAADAEQLIARYAVSYYHGPLATPPLGPLPSRAEEDSRRRGAA